MKLRILLGVLLAAAGFGAGATQQAEPYVDRGVVEALAMGPQSPAERIELAAALTRRFEGVTAWSLRAPPGWRPQDPDIDRVVIVDLAAHEIAGRLRWHRSITCFRSLGEAEWQCGNKSAETLVDVAAPSGLSTESPVCPASARNIKIGSNIAAETIPELTDFVRSLGAEPKLMSADSCGGAWTRLETPSFCEISAIRSPDPGSFRVSVRVGLAHFLRLRVRRDCAEGVCSLNLSRCRDVIY